MWHGGHCARPHGARRPVARPSHPPCSPTPACSARPRRRVCRCSSWRRPPRWTACPRRAVLLRPRAPPPRPDPTRPLCPPELAARVARTQALSRSPPPRVLLCPHTSAPPAPEPARHHPSASAPTGPRRRPSRPARDAVAAELSAAPAVCTGAAGGRHVEGCSSSFSYVYLTYVCNNMLTCACHMSVL